MDDDIDNMDDDEEEEDAEKTKEKDGDRNNDRSFDSFEIAEEIANFESSDKRPTCCTSSVSSIMKDLEDLNLNENSITGNHIKFSDADLLEDIFSVGKQDDSIGCSNSRKDVNKENVNSSSCSDNGIKDLLLSG